MIVLVFNKLVSAIASSGDGDGNSPLVAISSHSIFVSTSDLGVSGDGFEPDAGLGPTTGFGLASGSAFGDVLVSPTSDLESTNSLVTSIFDSEIGRAGLAPLGGGGGGPEGGGGLGGGIDGGGGFTRVGVCFSTGLSPACNDVSDVDGDNLHGVDGVDDAALVDDDVDDIAVFDFIAGSRSRSRTSLTPIVLCLSLSATMTGGTKSSAASTSAISSVNNVEYF